MPNRILKESVCTSENIDSLSWFQECFFYRLMVNCDDYGRMDARVPILKAKLFPLKPVADGAIVTALQALMDAHLINLYVVESRPYLYLNTWKDHQVIRAKRSKYPSPEESDAVGFSAFMQANDCRCKQMQADVTVIQSNPIQSNTESKTKSESKKEGGKNAKRFVPPAVEDVETYCRERGNGVDAEAFVAFYEAKGWMIGKSPMKDWKAAVRTWEQRDGRGPKKPEKGATPSYDISGFQRAEDIF